LQSRLKRAEEKAAPSEKLNDQHRQQLEKQAKEQAEPKPVTVSPKAATPESKPVTVSPKAANNAEEEAREAERQAQISSCQSGHNGYRCDRLKEFYADSCREHERALLLMCIARANGDTAGVSRAQQLIDANNKNFDREMERKRRAIIENGNFAGHGDCHWGIHKGDECVD
jgi:hypothetical protein